uniref:Lin-28 homolog A n=1 Tax=Electrophorus electricus TaxID=8005 RepID=A0A4W4H5Y3_ELEEL
MKRIKHFHRRIYTLRSLEQGSQGKTWPKVSYGCTDSVEGTDPLPMYGTGHCKWFNVRMGFGFISMTSRGGNPIDPPLDVFVHQSKLHMEGFRSLKEGETVEFTFKKSSKGLECVWVTGPGGAHCVGSERRPKGKSIQQKRKQKGDRCYNCGGLDHHAKECVLPPQPKKCHYCQSASHMVAHCPHKAPSAPQGRHCIEIGDPKVVFHRRLIPHAQHTST